MSRPLDNQYGAPTAQQPRAACSCAASGVQSLSAAPRADATYHGAPPAARKAAQSGMTTKTVLSYDNFFSEVATHPRSSTIATKCVASLRLARAAAALAPKALRTGRVAPAPHAARSGAQRACARMIGCPRRAALCGSPCGPGPSAPSFRASGACAALCFGAEAPRSGALLRGRCNVSGQRARNPVTQRR